MTPISTASNNLPDWMTVTGTTLDGGYELKEIVEAQGEQAVLRVRVLGDYSLKALASFYVTNKATGEEQVEIWRAIRYLDDKRNLSVPLGAGTLLLNGSTVAYLVFQNPDESLTDVISTRTLEKEEALEVLRSAAAGLEQLHTNDLVHGTVSPGEILAFGNSIQLSVESVRRSNFAPPLERKEPRYVAPESGSQNVTFSSDIWCLGASLFEAVTRKKYDASLLEEASELPHPLGVLASCCLDPDPGKRCKLADLNRIATSKAPPPKPKAVPAPKPPVEGELVGVAPTVAYKAIPADKEAIRTDEKVTIVPQPKAPVSDVKPLSQPEPASPEIELKPSNPPLPEAPITEAPLRPARNEWVNAGNVSSDVPPRAPSPTRDLGRQAKARETSDTTSGRKGWIYGLVAFVVIFVILWFLRSRSHTAQSRSNQIAQVPRTAPGTPNATSAPSGTAWPTKTLTPEAKGVGNGNASGRAAEPSTILRRNPAKMPAQSAPSIGAPARTVWRVVLYTYAQQQAAEDRARSISEKRPDLGTETFSPDGSTGPFLVVAGGQMDREEATRLRLRAIREGMPHDSYIQNFSH